MFQTVDNKTLVFLPYDIETSIEFDRRNLEEFILHTSEEYMDESHKRHLDNCVTLHGYYPWTFGWGIRDYVPLAGFDKKFPNIIDYIKDKLCLRRIRKLTFVKQQEEVWPHQDADEDGWAIRMHIWNDTQDRMYFQKVRPEFAEKKDLKNKIITGLETPWIADPNINPYIGSEIMYDEILFPEKHYANFPLRKGAWGFSNRWSVHGTDKKLPNEQKCIMVIYGDKDIDRLRLLHNRSYEKYKDFSITL